MFGQYKTIVETECTKEESHYVYPLLFINYLRRSHSLLLVAAMAPVVSEFFQHTNHSCLVLRFHYSACYIISAAGALLL